MYSLFSILKGLRIQNEVDTSKEVILQVSPSATTNTTTTLVTAQTADRTISFPDVTDTLSTATATETLENKTIDGNDNNTFLNIPADAFEPIPADANNFLVRDGSGEVVSDTKAVPNGDVVGTTDTQVLTNKTIDADVNTLSNIENADIKAGAAIAVNKLEALTSSRAVETNGSGFLSPSAVTATELGYVSGVTSAIQTQLDGKQTLDADLTAIANLASTGLITRTGSGTADVRTITAGSAKITVSNGNGVSGNPSIDVSEASLSLNNIGGTLGISKGGTGQTTANAALNALLPDQTGNSGKVLRTDGTDTSWQANTASTVPPTVTVFNVTGSTTGWAFFGIAVGNATTGAVYTDGTSNYTVLTDFSSNDVLYTDGTVTPLSNTLSKVSGTGSSSLTANRNKQMGTYTTPSNCVALKVTMVGAGGGGGSGASTASQSSAGGGGGSGATIVQWYYSPAATYYYVLGTAGNAGSGGAGGSGGATGFDINYMLAGGGSGGSQGSASATAGGGATGGAGGGYGASANYQDPDWGIPGGRGGTGINFGGTAGSISGYGAGSGTFGNTIAGVTNSAGTNAVSSAGTQGAYGSGGAGGAVTNGSGAKNGGRGGDGMIVIEEYY